MTDDERNLTGAPLAVTPDAPAPPEPATAPQPPASDLEVDFRVDFRVDAYEHKQLGGIGNLKDRRMIIATGNGSYVVNRTTTTPYLELATIFTGEVAWREINFKIGRTLIILKEKPEPPGCKLEAYFDSDFISLMQDAPNNKVLRAHMMRILKREPAAELDTFDKLKEWVESTFPKRISKFKTNPKRPPYPTAPQGVPLFVRVDLERPYLARTEHEPEIEVGIGFSCRSDGQCRYTQTKSCQFDSGITMEMIRRAIEGFGYRNIEQIFDKCLALAWEREDSNGLDYDYSDEDTSDHEESDSDRYTYYCDSRQARILEMVDFIREHSPETAETIGL